MKRLLLAALATALLLGACGSPPAPTHPAGPAGPRLDSVAPPDTLPIEEDGGLGMSGTGS